MRTVGLWASVAAIGALWVVPAVAQEAGPAGFPGIEDERPGAYASPSAIPDGFDERFGVVRPEGRQRFDPIELPPTPGAALDPSITLPSLPAFAPQPMPSRQIARPENSLVFTARLDADGEAIPEGLVWRLFSETLNRDGQLQLVGVSRESSAVFDVPPGGYVLHVGYGRAGMTKRIAFAGQRTEDVIVLAAGGLRLNAIAAPGEEQSIHSDRLSFDVFTQAEFDQDRQLVADDVPADAVIRLNAGEYHVVSNYGQLNAVARADVRVETGRITNARLQHRAAELTMKLVREKGGEAIAETAWSISSSQGDVVRESLGAFSSLVLAEGDYVVVAENRDRIYQQDFTVTAGENAEIELLASDPATPVDSQTPDGFAGSGD